MQFVNLYGKYFYQAELAETMGMKSDSMFVQQIFQLADKDSSGYLSFKEFADLIIILMKGKD